MLRFLVGLMLITSLFAEAAEAPALVVVRSESLSPQQQGRWRQSLEAQLFEVAQVEVESNGCNACWILQLEKQTGPLTLTLTDARGKTVYRAKTMSGEGTVLEFEVGALVRSQLTAFLSSVRQRVGSAGSAEKTVVLSTPPVRAAAEQTARTASMPEARPAETVTAPAWSDLKQPAEPGPPSPVVDVAPEPAVPSAQAAPAREAATATTLTQAARPLGREDELWRLNLAYSLRRPSSLLALQNGLSVAVDVRVWRQVFVGLRYGLVLPSVLDLDTVKIELTRHEGFVVTGFDLPFSWASVGPELALGFGSTRRQTVDAPTLASISAASGSLSFVAGLKAHGRFWFPRWPLVRFDLAPAVDFVFGEPRYVFRNGAGTATAAVDPIQPRIDLGISLVF